MLEDLNEEIRLQNEADDPFSQHIVYAPAQSAQKPREFQNSREPAGKHSANSEIPPDRHEQQLEEKLASPLPIEYMNKPLLQCINNRRGEIPLVIRDVRSKPPTYTA